MIIQIYAFTEVKEALAAAALGVDQIGFVAGDYGVVHGELSFEQARGLVEALPSETQSVALTMATEVDEILRMAAAVQPDILHISTDVYDVDVRMMAELRRGLPEATQLMKAIPVADHTSISQAAEFAPVSDLLLLDTKGLGLPGVGASGRTHDWRVSRQIVEAVNIPVILAGGLTPGNVESAIATVQPWGVDSNTGTNLPNDPVKKDMDRIRAFVDAARGQRSSEEAHG
jgi:phosphoribosylanthranilate isomerase